MKGRGIQWAPYPAPITPPPTQPTAAELRAMELLALEREIATEACRVDIECWAVKVPSSYPRPVYDTTQVERSLDEPEILASYLAAIERAVRYLDMRGLLVRPVPDMPQFVAFAEAMP